MFLYILVITLATVVFPFLILYGKQRRLYRLVNKLPHPDPIPIFGNLDKILGFPHKSAFTASSGTFLQATNGYSVLFRDKGLYCMWFGPDVRVGCFRADTVEKVLSTTTNLDKADDYVFLHPWLGTGLLTSTGDKWKSRRRLLTPTFHFRILEEFLPIFNEQAQVFVNRLRKHSLKGPVDIVRLTSLCTLDIICETAMGIKLNAQSDDKSPYVSSIESLSSIITMRSTKPWLSIDLVFNLSSYRSEYYRHLKVVQDFTQKVIAERKQEMLAKIGATGNFKNEESELGIKKRQAFMDLLLSIHLNSGNFNEKDIQEEVDTFMFEGHDTTSMGISWAMFLLGWHPEIQEKVFEELTYVLGDDKDSFITTEHLTKLKYLECVIKESQRIYPSVPMISRRLIKDARINDYIIPSGTTVEVLIYMLHRDPDIYPDPEKFDPDRFLPENASGRHPFAFVPFSAGPRNCIGQRFAFNEEKVVLAHVLRNFCIRSVSQRDSLRLVPDLVLRSRDGVYVCLDERT